MSEKINEWEIIKKCKWKVGTKAHRLFIKYIDERVRYSKSRALLFNLEALVNEADDYVESLNREKDDE